MEFDFPVQHKTVSYSMLSIHVDYERTTCHSAILRPHWFGSPFSNGSAILNSQATLWQRYTQLPGHTGLVLPSVVSASKLIPKHRAQWSLSSTYLRSAEHTSVLPIATSSAALLCLAPLASTQQRHVTQPHETPPVMYVKLPDAACT
ncbi:hypothetical protein E2C01_043342 [Portunus trituberculatus]|uniref:Uncharacterized protein n=1 Tax=Portunus trituberculatus TaxID=210409 RepID=A0A5B7FW62_PORTR|nr:hypothetical protein [Portunus trituberculatus]